MEDEAVGMTLERIARRRIRQGKEILWRGTCSACRYGVQSPAAHGRPPRQRGMKYPIRTGHQSMEISRISQLELKQPGFVACEIGWGTKRCS